MTTFHIDKKVLGLRIRSTRIDMGVSQQELADYINRNLSCVGSYERGISMPPEDILRRIAHRLHRKFDWFIREEAHDHASV
jgi:transcriptional regulator with XRE-family HTH domain